MRLYFLISLSLFLLPLPSGFAAEDLELVFSRVKAKAAVQSFGLKLASEGVAKAEAQGFSAWSHWVPRLDLTLTQTRSKDYSFLTSGTLGSLTNLFPLTPQASSLSRWELDLSFPMYRRTVHAGINQAIAEKYLAQCNYDQRSQELGWQLRNYIGQYILQRYKKAALQTSIEIAKKNLRESELSFELGQKTKIDILRSKSNLLALQSRQLSSSQDENTAMNALLEFSGLTLQELKDLGFFSDLANEEGLSRALDRFTQLDEILPKIAPFVDEKAEINTIQEMVVSSSAAYAEILAEEKVSFARAAVLNSDQFPSLDLRGALNKQSDQWGQALGSDNVSYSAAMVLTIPLFSGGSLFSTSLEKSHSEKIGKIQFEKDFLKLRDSIENDRILIRTLLASLDAQRAAREQNEEIVRLTQKSYQLGRSTLVELLGSQSDLIDSKINLAKTKNDLAVTARKFAWNLGVQVE